MTKIEVTPRRSDPLNILTRIADNLVQRVQLRDQEIAATRDELAALEIERLEILDDLDATRAAIAALTHAGRESGGSGNG